VFIFKNSELAEKDFLSTEIAQKNSKVSVYAKRSAVIGCKFGDWRLASREDQLDFYKEDKPTTAKDWDGGGELSLGDFKEFAAFLSEFYRKHNAQK
jgi:hypothetical protein